MSTDDQAGPGPADPTPVPEPAVAAPSATPPVPSPPAGATVPSPPVGATLPSPPAGATLPTTPPLVTPPGATLGAETRAARAAHVADRAHPTPPEPAWTSGRLHPAPADEGGRPEDAPPQHDVVVGVTGAGPAPTPVPTPDPAPTTPAPMAPAPATPEEEVFPTVVPPRRVGFGGHLLGVLVGLVLGPFAVLVAGLGESRIALAYAPPQTAWIDALGTTLVAVGALVLICVVVLGVWTAAVPITAGVIVTAAGVTFLVIPERAYTEVLRIFRTDANALTVGQLDLQGVTGVVLLLGVVLLAAGVAIAVARRTGRRHGRLAAAASATA